jgi:hypothetical protein
MLRCMALVRTDVSKERSASIISASVASYGYVNSSPILVLLMMEALRSSDTSVLARATGRNIPEDAILLKKTFVISYSFPSSGNNDVHVCDTQRHGDVGLPLPAQDVYNPASPREE